MFAFSGSGRWASKALFLALWLASAPCRVSAMKIKVSGLFSEGVTWIAGTGTWHAWSGYGLAPGGTIEIDVQAKQPAPKASLIVLNEEQHEILERMKAKGVRTIAHKDLDLLPSMWHGSFHSPRAPSPLQGVFTVQTAKPQPFYVAFIGSPNKTIELEGGIELRNPGSWEHLRWQDTQRPLVQLILAGFHGLSVLFLLLAVLRYWHSRSKLHLLLLATAAMQVLAHLAEYLHLERMSRLGVIDFALGDFGNVMLQDIARNMQLCSCFVLGLGWKIVRPHMRPSELSMTAMIMLVSSAFSALHWVCRHHLARVGQTHYCIFFFLMQYTLRCFSYLIVVCAVNCNIFMLQRQIIEALAVPESGELYAKCSAYNWFRLFFLLHIMIAIPAHGPGVQLPKQRPESRAEWEEEWIVKLLSGIMEWGALFAILVLFSPLGLRSLKVFKLAVHDSSDSSSDS